MQVFNQKKTPTSNTSSIVTIGNFDGIHLGHRALINKIVSEANNKNFRSALVSFDPHPQEIIHSKTIVPKICTAEHQLHLFEEIGLDEIHLVPFTKKLSQMPPEEFALQFLINRFNLSKLIIGYDFRFGKFRAGDFKLLENLSKKYNFLLEEVSPVKEKGQTVSSTLIRKLIKEFRFSEIHSYLGREFSLYGQVVLGDQQGKKLGFPTANIKPETTLALQNGVYVCKIKLDNKTHYGISNVGIKPTFGKNDVTIETLIFNFEEDIYRKFIEVIPLYLLRLEKKFISVKELKKQISLDIKNARNYLHEHEILPL